MAYSLETQGSTSSGSQISSTDSSGGEGNHRCLSVLQGHEGHVFSLALAGGTLYSGSDCGEIRSWRQLEFQESVRFGSGEGSVKAMVVVGSKVYSAHQDQKIRVWKRSRGDPGAHKLVATLPTVTDYMRTCMTPKNYIQVRRHKKVLWIDHNDTISVLAVGKDVLYSGSWDKTIKVWRLADLKCIESIDAHNDAVNTLEVDQDKGFLYSGSADGTIKVWERGCMGTMHHSLVAILESKNSTINALALSNNGNYLYAASSDKSITIWEKDDEGTVKHMKIAGLLRGHRLAVLCLTSIADLLISGSADKTLRVWRRGSDGLHSCISVMQGHKGPVKSLAASVDPVMGVLVYSGSMDRTVRVWWIPQEDPGSSPDEFLSPLESPFLLNCNFSDMSLQPSTQR